MPTRILNRISALWRREQIHREIADEREFHIAMRVSELMRGGMAEDAATQAAQRKFGATLRLHEQGFDARGGGGLLQDIAADLRIALRILRKSPAKTAALVATMALGIGLNTAVFSIVKAVILDPLPFPESTALVVIHQLAKGAPEGVSYPNFKDWEAASRSFQSMAVYAPDSSTVTTNGQAHRVFGAVVSADLFRALRVAPLRGRLFTSAEDKLGSGHPVIISDTLWRSQFHSREDVLGQPLLLDGLSYRVIGVIASTLAFPLHSDAANYWVTVAADAEPSSWGGNVSTSRGYPRYEAALARLKPGVTLSQAQAELNLVARNLARRYPEADLSNGVRLQPAIQDVTGKIRPLLWTLYGAVFCVLAVACANTAALLLVGAIARSREFALRAALGARTSRLIRQLLVESVTIALAGGALGLLLARGLLAVFSHYAPPETPRLNMTHPSSAMLFYALALSIGTGLVFGIAPVAALRTSLVAMLKGETRARRSGRLRPGTVLIAAQIAVSMALGCSAVLLTASFWRILNTPKGFDAHNVLTASISLPAQAYPQGSQKVTGFYTGLVEALRRAPGVETASAAQSLPLSGQNNNTRLQVFARPDLKDATVDLRFVEPDYFNTLRIPLLEGRYPNPADRTGQPQIAVVNRAFAARFLPAGRTVGNKLRLGWGGDAPKLIVGVVGNIRHHALAPQPTPEVYVPIAQFPVNVLAVLIRARGGLPAAALTLRAELQRLDPRLPLENVRSLEDCLLQSAAPHRLLMWVLLVLAAGALLLSAIGLYGALSYSTLCRQREFGIRMALGSKASGVMVLVLREGLAVAISGVTAGLLLTLLVTPLLRSWLFETNPLDLLSLACAGTILLSAALAACWAPARRATQVNPLIALRAD